uniref:Uncharacterized protein n=1 Tax=Rhodopseudomonas palustris (strain DX-1) TaxID=652103 RepID=E6VQ09_RHOPX
MKELIASFPHSNFEKYYFFSLFYWILLSIGALGIVMYIDREKIFVQREQNYLRILFSTRPKVAIALLLMFASAYISVIVLIILGSLAKRYSGAVN